MSSIFSIPSDSPKHGNTGETTEKESARVSAVGGMRRRRVAGQVQNVTAGRPGRVLRPAEGDGRGMSVSQREREVNLPGLGIDDFGSQIRQNRFEGG